MLKTSLLTVSILLFSQEFIFAAQDAEKNKNTEEIKISPNVKTQSLEDLTMELEAQKKKDEPFDEKKVPVDLESLGLDNVDDKKNVEITNPAIEEPIAANDRVIKTEKREKENEIISGAKNIFSKIQNMVSQQPSATAPVEQPTSKYDIKRPVTNYLKLDKKTTLNKRINFEKKKKEIAKIKKKQEEKMLRLNNLREEYLVEITHPKPIDEELETKDSYNSIIKPQEKNLSWSNKFISYDMPPEPILDRYRGNDNKHIPIITNVREKIDMLFEAISRGNIAAFNDSYNDILNPDIHNINGDTILTYAIILQKYPVIASVLAKGADPDLPNALGHTPLDITIELLDLKAANMLIDAKADPFYVDGYGRTYLMHAARVGFYPMCDFLYSQGIDIDAMDDEGYTALAIAYRHKKEIIAKFLLQKGAKTWIEKPYEMDKQHLIKELETKWKKR